MIEIKEFPNMSKEVLAFLENTISEESSILEFGSGSSTIWFAQHAKKVVSFENQNDWYQAVKKKLKELKLTNVDLRHDPDYIYKGCPEFGVKFNLILIDSKAWVDGKRIESRLICAKTACKYVRKGGWLLLDDSATKICKFTVIFMDELNWERQGISGEIQATAWKRPL